MKYDKQIIFLISSALLLGVLFVFSVAPKVNGWFAGNPCDEIPKKISQEILHDRIQKCERLMLENSSLNNEFDNNIKQAKANVENGDKEDGAYTMRSKENAKYREIKTKLIKLSENMGGDVYVVELEDGNQVKQVEEVPTSEPVSSETAGMYIKNSSGYMKPIPEGIYGNSTEKRFKNFSSYYNVDSSVFMNAANTYSVNAYVLMCISWAETTMGLEAKSPNNLMNYGNNDRGDVINYESRQQGINEAANGLVNGTYLKGNEVLGHLSGGGRTALGLPYGCTDAPVDKKCYATSPVNWRINVNNCMTFVHGTKEDWDNFRYK